MSFSSYESSDNASEDAWSSVASILPSVFDSAILSEISISNDDLLKASKIYALPRVDLDYDVYPEFEPVFLGAGASYRVYAQRFKQWKSPLAVKYIRTATSSGNRASIASGAQRLTVLREIHCLCLFKDHPNIITLFAWGQNVWGELNAFLVTDYAPLGSLDCFLRERGSSLTSDILFKICADVAQGIDGMHSQRMVHGDVKTENVLLFAGTSSEDNFTAKLSDLGFSISLDFDDRDTCYRGTDLYNAPEIRSGGSRRIKDLHPLACDVYSLGLLVWTVFRHGVSFLTNLHTAAVDMRSEEQVLDSVDPFQILDLAKDFARARKSPEEAEVLSQVFSACLQIDDKARLTIRAICRLLDPLIPHL